MQRSYYYLFTRKNVGGGDKRKKIDHMDETKPYIDVNHERNWVHKTFFMDRPQKS